LEGLHFKWCILSDNETDIAVYFFKMICLFLLIHFITCVSKISDKTVMSWLNYRNLCWDPVFIGTQRAKEQLFNCWFRFRFTVWYFSHINYIQI